MNSVIIPVHAERIDSAHIYIKCPFCKVVHFYDSNYDKTNRQQLVNEPNCAFFSLKKKMPFKYSFLLTVDDETVRSPAGKRFLLPRTLRNLPNKTYVPTISVRPCTGTTSQVF